MKIALLGDIAFYGKYSIDGNEDVFSYFKSVSDYLKDFDFVVGNLETPFVINEKPHGYKSAYIKSDPVNVRLLNYLNINVVNLANNHIFDYGEKSYLLTKKLLTDFDIKYFGVEGKQVLLEVSGSKVALHGYCGYSTNPCGISKDYGFGINELSLPRVEQNLKLNDKLGYLNIVSAHFGQEHVNYPCRDDIRMARQFSEICPYILYGHHPHVMQGVEEINGSVIAYSLGNLCFDDVYTRNSDKPLIKQSENNKASFILELEICGNNLVSHSETPIYAGDESLVVNVDGVTAKLEAYTEKLSIDEVAYEKMRSELTREYIESRKKLRNLKFYLKRIKFRYFMMVLFGRLNKKRNTKNVKGFLND